MKLSAAQAVDVLRAAGEPTRLRILALLAHEELAVLELCRVLDQNQPRVSRPLKLFAAAGLRRPAAGGPPVPRGGREGGGGRERDARGLPHPAPPEKFPPRSPARW